MKTPVRTPEGDPRWCPLCRRVQALEVSLEHRDATCPRCGTLMLPGIDGHPLGRFDLTGAAGFEDLLAADMPPAGTPGAARPARDTGAAGRAINREQDALVAECLDGLPPHHREVLVLRDYDGLEWREIAQRLSMKSDSAARELHCRALLDLARRLRERGFGAATRSTW